MPTVLFANNASSSLASAISSSATSLTLVSGGGASFPSPSSAQYFVLTIISATNSDVFEIVHCTARSTDSLTIVRGQEGTTAQAWNVGDIVVNQNTAGTMDACIQAPTLQQQPGNYAQDTGSVNALSIALSPAPTSMASLEGIPIRVMVLNTNTGASTLEVNGLGAQPIKGLEGYDTAAGTLLQNAIYTFLWSPAASQFFFYAPLQQRVQTFTTDTGTANAYAITLNPGPLNISGLIGASISVQILNTNTGASTLEVLNFSAVESIKHSDGTDVAAGEIVGGLVYQFAWNGTYFNFFKPA